VEEIALRPRDNHKARKRKANTDEKIKKDEGKIMK